MKIMRRDWKLCSSGQTFVCKISDELSWTFRPCLHLVQPDNKWTVLNSSSAHNQYRLWTIHCSGLGHVWLLSFIMKTLMCSYASVTKTLQDQWQGRCCQPTGVLISRSDATVTKPEHVVCWTGVNGEVSQLPKMHVKNKYKCLTI